MSRSRYRMILAVLTAVLPLVGCTGGNAETPKPKPPAVFDPQNAESTFRWVIKNAEPLLAASKLASAEQSNNPLRKDQQNACEQERRRWKEFLDKIVGTHVVWPVCVGMEIGVV